MPTAPQSKTDQLKRKLAEAQSLAALVTNEVTSDKLSREKQFDAYVQKVAAQNSALLLAYVSEVPVPLGMLKPWASIPRIKQWSAAGHFEVVLRNGKLTCIPSHFFDFYRNLKDEGGRSKK